MFTFLLVLHALVAASLVAVILLQRSEGGGLGMGGSPSGLMSARGAADFLTRSTTILATIFVLMSIGLAAYAGVQRAQRPIDTSLARSPAAPAAPAGGSVPLADPLAGAAAATGNASAPLIPPTAPATTPPAARKAAAEPRKPSASEAPAATAEPKPASATSVPPAPAPKTEKPAPAETPPTPAPAGNGSVPLVQ